MEELKKDVLLGVIDRIAREIQINHIGAYMYDKEDEYGYDLVMWNRSHTPYKKIFKNLT